MSGGTPGRFRLSGCGGRLTVAVHDAEHDGRDDADGERDGEVVNDVGVLLPLVVADHGQRVVLPRIVARERGAQAAVRLGEVGTGDGRRVPTTLDVDQQHGFRHDYATGTGRAVSAAATDRPVRHVDVTAVVHVAGAPFPARAPRAVVQAGQLLAAHRRALHRFRHEVGQQRGHGRVHVQRDEEQQRGARADRDHGEGQRGVEPHLLAQRPRSAALLLLGRR